MNNKTSIGQIIIQYGHRLVGGNRLSFRLMSATLIYSILVAILVSVLQIWLAYRNAVDQANNSFSQIETSYLPNMATAIWLVDSNQINHLVDGISKFPHVGIVRVVDETGIEWLRTPDITNFLVEKRFPIIYQEENMVFNLGSLTLTLTATQIRESLKTRAIGIAITSSVTLMLGSLFVLFIFQRWVSRHLNHMANFAENISIHNLSTPLRFQRPHSAAEDELDIVAKSINRMQLTLKEDLELRARMEQKLIRHQENLEKIVAQRTSELQIKNALLELQSLELEANNQDLDSYAQSVAHDLKNPLTTLIGLSSLLNYSLASFSPEKLQESLNTIHRTSIKMVNIIDALLLLSSVRKSTDIDIKPLDIKHIASEAQHRLASLAEKAHASINFVGDWPMAMGYAQWIEEVWMNYLSNAIKYGGNPPIIEIGGELISPSLAKFWVRDFGKGINKEKSEKLFLPFSRIDHTTSDGHGLGLSIVKRIVERLNGKVGYEAGDKDDSDPSADVGGYFWFTLPVLEESK